MLIRPLKVELLTQTKGISPALKYSKNEKNLRQTQWLN